MNQEKDYPVFPLHTVLFPGCKIALRIFEQRYLRMVKECTQHDRPFVVSLIKGQGSEVGEASECYRIGTLARIIDFNQGHGGALDIVARAGSRVMLSAHHHDPDKLLRAQLEPFSEPEVMDLPEHYLFFRNILDAIRKDNPEFITEKTESLSATEISFYLSHIAPVSMPKRQKLLEIQNTEERLSHLQEIFSQTRMTFTA